MGADEKSESIDEGLSAVYADEVLEKLDSGWRIVSRPDGQLLLVPPPAYGDAPSAA